MCRFKSIMNVLLMIKPVSGLVQQSTHIQITQNIKQKSTKRRECTIYVYYYCSGSSRAACVCVWCDLVSRSDSNQMSICVSVIYEYKYLQ